MKMVSRAWHNDNISLAAVESYNVSAMELAKCRLGVL